MADKRQRLTRDYMGIVEGLPLEASSGGVDDLRRDIQHLMDREAIRQLKHAYFRCIDTANIEELATLLHDDVLVDFKGGNYRWQLNGREEYVQRIAESFNGQAIAQHHGHSPEIQLLSDTEATGIWYLEDRFWVLEHKVYTEGTCIYWDRYVKENGRWLIRETRYERLYESIQLQEQPPTPSVHYLAEI